MLTDDCRFYLKKLSSDDRESEKKLFGSHIKYETSSTYSQDTNLLHDLKLVEALASKERTLNGFSMKYEEKVDKPEVPKDIYNRSWLCKHVNPDLIDLLVDALKSNKSNDELQNELFELLGFDKFEIIQEILQNRKAICKFFEMVEMKEQIKEHILKQQNAPKVAPAPAFLMPVLFQSEKEKGIMKQIAKDEKKLKSLKVSNLDIEEEEITVASLRLNQTQSFLKIAQTKPLMLERSKDTPRYITTPQVKYPNVFDSNKEAKSHVGFISGNKLMLPENVVRKDNKMYEEVVIPAPDPPVLSVGNTRIQVTIVLLVVIQKNL